MNIRYTYTKQIVYYDLRLFCELVINFYFHKKKYHAAEYCDKSWPKNDFVLFVFDYKSFYIRL